MLTSLLDDRVRVARGFLAPERAAAVFAELLGATPWLAVRYENAGAPASLPRLTVNYGERSYDYSGLVFTPLPWTPLLAELRAQVEPPAQASRVEMNCPERPGTRSDRDMRVNSRFSGLTCTLIRVHHRYALDSAKASFRCE